MSDIQLKSGQFSELKFGVDQSELDNLANEFNTKLNQTNSQIDSKLLEAAKDLEAVRTNTLKVIEEKQEQNAAELQDVKSNLLSDIEAANKKITDDFKEAIGASEKKILDDAALYVNEIAGGLQSQIDGEVNSWFFEGEPKLTNKPAIDWDESDYIKHAGDTYTDITAYVDNETTPTAGRSWRWCEGNVDGETIGYHWHEIADSDAVKALREAGQAMATADGKSTIFYNVPEKYQMGDMWILQDSYSITYEDGEKSFIKGTILNANNDSETFVATDWTENVRYTDDEAANLAQQAAEDADAKAAEAKKTANVAKNQLDEIDNDNIIAVTEFATLETQLETIEAEYKDIIADVEKYDDTNYKINSDSYTASYNNAITALKYHCGKEYDENNNKATRVKYEIDGEEFEGGIEIVFEGDYGYNNIALYYDARQTILSLISNAAAAVANAYADEINDKLKQDLEKDLDDAKANVAEANRIAQEAKDQLGEWASDSVISPLEIQGIKDEQARILADYEEIKADYKKYHIGEPEDYLPVNFNNAYSQYNNHLSAFITGVANTKAPVEIPDDPETGFAACQKKFYDERTAAYNAIAAAVEKAANDFAAAEADRKAKAEATAVKNALDSQLTEVNNKIKDADDVAKAAKQQLLDWSSDSVISPLEIQGIKDELTRITTDYNEIRDNYEDYSMDSDVDIANLEAFEAIYENYKKQLDYFISEVAKTNAPVKMPTKEDDGGSFADNQTAFYNKRTEMYKFIAAKVKEISDAYANKVAEEEAGKAKEEAEKAKKEAEKSLQLLDDMSNDNLITPQEAVNVKKEWNSIIDEYNNNIDKSNEIFNINRPDEYFEYVNSYDSLEAYLYDIGLFNGIRAYKCDWNPEEGYYEEDNEYYLYTGKTINIDNQLYYIWEKYENNIKLNTTVGKARILTSSLDFECNLDNPYEIEYVIHPDDTINNDYQGFTDDNGYPEGLCRIEGVVEGNIDNNGNIIINPSDFQYKFNYYYKCNVDLLNAISKRISEEEAEQKAGAVKIEINNDLSNVKSRLSTAEQKAIDAEKKLDLWDDDNKITHFEVAGIKDEMASILADKTEIDAECSQYNLTENTKYTEYGSAYETYNSHLTTCSKATSSAPVTIPSGFADSQSNYYTKRTAIYTELAKTVQTTANNYAVTAAAAAAAEVQKVVKADIQEAKDAADAVDTALKNATDVLSKSLSDGYLSKDEQESLKNVKSQLDGQYNQFDKEHTDVYNSKYLDGTEKTNLSSTKSTLYDKYTNFSTALNTLIGKTITGTKLQLTGWTYNSNFKTPKDEFYTALTNYSEALAKAQSKINSNIELENKRYTDSIEIGGTNLLAKNNQIVSTGSNIATRYDTNEEVVIAKRDNLTYVDYAFVTTTIVDSTDYILTFEAKSNINGAKINSHFYSPNTTTNVENSQGYIGAGVDGSSLLTLTTEWKKYWVKWKQSNTTTTKSCIVARNLLSQNGDSCIVYIRNSKLEKGNKATAWSPAPEDVEARIEATNSYISGIESNLQNQIDGVVDSWFMEGQPTLNNKPANEWTTDDLKKRHVGDTYTNINSAETDNTGGQSWRWCPGTGEGDPANTGYHWHKIADNDAVLALQKAAQAQDAADSKRRVFTSTPTVPYDEGDLWVDANKKTLVCITPKDNKSSYAFADWVDTTNADAVKAKNDAAVAQGTANEAKNAAIAAQSAAEAQEYMKAVLEKGSTDIKGGLVLTNVLALKDTNGTVASGMSGLKDDNILLWGGGTYDDAVTAKNNTTTYKKQNGTPITTLLKKDGTGKLGIFRIESSKASVYDTDGKERVLITTASLGDYIEDFFDAADNDIKTLELNRTYSSSSSPTPSIVGNSLNTTLFKYTTYVLADTLLLPEGGASGDYVLRGNLNISGRIFLSKIDTSFNPDYYDPEKKVNIEASLTIANTNDSNDRGLVVKLYSRELQIFGENGKGNKYIDFEFNRDLNNLLSISSSARYNVRLSISITPINCSFSTSTYTSASNKTTLINSAQNITVNGKIYFTNDKNSQTAVARDGLSIISNPYNYFMVDSTSPKFQKIFINGIPGQTNVIDVASQVEDNQLYMDCYKTNESTDPTYRFMENLYNFVSAAYSGLHLLLSKADGLEMDSRLTKMYLADLERTIGNIKKSLKEVNILCLKDTGDFNMLNDDI